MVTRVVPLTVSLRVFAGCSKPLDLALPKDAALKPTVNPLGVSLNKPATTCSISPGSARFKQLETLLAANRGGWESSLATYLPGVVVTGKGFPINFQHGIAVVNFAKGQYTRSISKTA